MSDTTPDPENVRLDEDLKRVKTWKRWGPYLSERQWGTVRGTTPVQWFLENRPDFAQHVETETTPEGKV